MRSPASTTTPKTELPEQLHALRLPRTAEDLDDFLARATKQRWSARVVLEELVRQETAEREHRSLERRLLEAKLGRFKPIDEFDWNWPTQIDRPALIPLPRTRYELAEWKPCRVNIFCGVPPYVAWPAWVEPRRPLYSRRFAT